MLLLKRNIMKKAINIITGLVLVLAPLTTVYAAPSSKHFIKASIGEANKRLSPYKRCYIKLNKGSSSHTTTRLCKSSTSFAKKRCNKARGVRQQYNPAFSNRTWFSQAKSAGCFTKLKAKETKKKVKVTKARTINRAKVGRGPIVSRVIAGVLGRIMKKKRPKYTPPNTVLVRDAVKSKALPRGTTVAHLNKSLVGQAILAKLKLNPKYKPPPTEVNRMVRALPVQFSTKPKKKYTRKKRVKRKKK